MGYPIFKQGNHVINKEGKVGCVIIDSDEYNSKVIVAFVSSNTVSAKAYPKEELSIANCPFNSGPCTYEGSNTYMKDLNCIYCKSKKERNYTDEF